MVALVGYTNAGKSTLFNALTESEVYAQDQLFATLDQVIEQVVVGKDGGEQLSIVVAGLGGDRAAVEADLAFLGSVQAQQQLDEAALDAGVVGVVSADYLPGVVEACVDADVMCEASYTDIKTGEPATGHVRAALERGMHVVTTNKGPVALFYPELKKLARTPPLPGTLEAASISSGGWGIFTGEVRELRESGGKILGGLLLIGHRLNRRAQIEWVQLDLAAAHTLQVEDVPLIYPGWFAQSTTGEHVGKFAGDELLVFGDISGLLHHMKPHTHGGKGVTSSGIDLLRQRRMITTRGHV